MREVAHNVAVFEVIGNDACVTVRVFGADKRRDELIFPSDTTLSFKLGVMSADKEPIVIESAEA